MTENKNLIKKHKCRNSLIISFRNCAKLINNRFFFLQRKNNILIFTIKLLKNIFLSIQQQKNKKTNWIATTTSKRQFKTCTVCVHNLRVWMPAPSLCQRVPFFNTLSNKKTPVFKEDCPRSLSVWHVSKNCGSDFSNHILIIISLMKISVNRDLHEETSWEAIS